MDLKMLHGLPPWLILGAGFAVGWIKTFWNFVYEHTVLVVEKKIRVAITIEEQDHKDAFRWLNMWVEDKLKQRKVSDLRIERVKYSNSEDYDNKFTMLPGYGFYYLFWNKKLVTFTSSKKEAGGDSYNSNNKLIRTINLTIWGTRNRNKILDVILEARDKYLQNNPKRIKYFVHKTDYWEDYPLKERPLNTIYLPEDQLSALLKTIADFHSSEDKYRNLGIPYRLGILLDGPPGSGKTSIVQVLASHFKMKVYYVSLSQVNGVGLSSLLAECEAPCIVLMEDVDCVGAAKERIENKTEDSSVKGLGLQTNELLNILDGLVATEERIVIMTTNYPEKLDKALIRSGRVDRRFHIGYAADSELNKFYQQATKYYELPEFSVFRNTLPEKCTIADAQAKVFEIQRKTLDKELEP